MEHVYYYVYYSYEPWGRGYIGKRECRCRPDEDDKYFGSYRDKSFNPSEKIILFVCSSREEAYNIECKLHSYFEVDSNPYFANRSRQRSDKFYFNAPGEKNPNYGKSYPEHVINIIREATTARLRNWKDNPFRLKGELSMSHGRKWVTNQDKTEELYLKPGEDPPEGWVPGRMKRPPRTAESRMRTSKALKGKKKSEPHKQNLREATLNYFRNLKEKGNEST